MLSEDWAWGRIPQGFKKIADKAGSRLVVRIDRENSISISLCRQQGEKEHSPGFEGREKLRAIRLPDGEIALVRAYRHGGLLRAVTGRLFLGWPPRPFRELAVTEELRHRGIPTVEVYGACVTKVWGPLYRGWIVTRQLAGAQDLWMALRTGFLCELGTGEVLRAVARSVRMLHREGVYHCDLNLKNILVRRERGGVRGYIIDFDRAKLLLGDLPPPLARRSLRRLLRSIRKLDPERKYFSNSSWDEFVRYYHGSEI
ncbi:MAG TPA: lipopolysaccharide kinase InaA family protein [Candidatus Binatia bacterium]|nr:lipopolysaccharide kinase InaA family protein [Candidatus Binatia bacterium]